MAVTIQQNKEKVMCAEFYFQQKEFTGAGNFEGNVLTFSGGCEGIKSGFNASMASSSI
jgi:hypothetical protein